MRFENTKNQYVQILHILSPKAMCKNCTVQIKIQVVPFWNRLLDDQKNMGNINQRNVVWFKEVTKKDVELVGGK